MNILFLYRSQKQSTFTPKQDYQSTNKRSRDTAFIPLFQTKVTCVQASHDIAAIIATQLQFVLYISLITVLLEDR